MGPASAGVLGGNHAHHRRSSGRPTLLFSVECDNLGDRWADAPVNGITYTLISFGAYADLGYGNAAYGAPLAGSLSHWGHPKSHLDAAATTTRVYDTYSTHYETVALTPQPTGTTPGQAVNGFDDDGDGIVDDIVYNGVSTAGENITAPPYPIPLRGIQVKIRVFEPDSRQVREVTVVQDFLTQ